MAIQVTLNNVNVKAFVEACGYEIEGDKIVKKYNLSDFEEALTEYIQAELDAGRNSNTIEENFIINDAREFIQDFEYEYKEDK